MLRKRIAKRGRPEERNMDPQLLINLQKRYDDWLYYKNTTYPIPSKVLVLDGTMTVEKFTPYVHSQLPKIFPSKLAGLLRCQKILLPDQQISEIQNQNKAGRLA